MSFHSCLRLAALLFAIAWTPNHAQALVATAGDISVIGVRADATDAVAFVSWIDISAGDKVYFTDSGFFSDGTLRDSEDIMMWTAPAGGVGAGTVIVISSSDSNTNGTADLGTATGRLNGLSASGDQTFVGTAAFPNTGDTSAPGSSYGGTLLYGIDFANALGWDSNAADSNTSALPSALNSANRNFSLATDNGQYTGSRTGMTIAQFKAAIHNAANWTTNDDGAAFGNLSSTDFTITAVPELSAFAIVAAALAAGVVTLPIRRRPRRRALAVARA